MTNFYATSKEFIIYPGPACLRCLLSRENLNSTFSASISLVSNWAFCAVSFVTRLSFLARFGFSSPMSVVALRRFLLLFVAFRCLSLLFLAFHCS